MEGPDIRKEDEMPYARALIEATRRIVDDVDWEVGSKATDEQKGILCALMMKNLISSSRYNDISFQKEGGEHCISIDGENAPNEDDFSTFKFLKDRVRDALLMIKPKEKRDENGYGDEF